MLCRMRLLRRSKWAVPSPTKLSITRLLESSWDPSTARTWCHCLALFKSSRCCRHRFVSLCHEWLDVFKLDEFVFDKNQYKSDYVVGVSRLRKLSAFCCSCGRDAFHRLLCLAEKSCWLQVRVSIKYGLLQDRFRRHDWAADKNVG